MLLNISISVLLNNIKCSKCPPLTWTHDQRRLCHSSIASLMTLSQAMTDLRTGSRHSISQLHGHGASIQLGADTVPACDHVRLLGVIISCSWSEPRPPCVHRQFGVLLLATTTSTSSPITRWRIGSHTGSRLCYVQGRLLQSAVGRSTKVCYRQSLNQSIRKIFNVSRITNVIARSTET